MAADPPLGLAAVSAAVVSHDHVLRNQNVGSNCSGRLRTPVMHGDPDQHVFRISLGVLDEDIEVAIFIEDAGVEQFVLHLFA